MSMSVWLRAIAVDMNPALHGAALNAVVASMEQAVTGSRTMSDQQIIEQAAEQRAVLGQGLSDE